MLRTRPSPEDVLAAWLDHLRLERDASPHTLAAYARDVHAVLHAVGARGDASDWSRLVPDRLLRWLDRERASGRAPSSIARRGAALKGWCRFALSLGALETDPTARLPATRGWDRVPKALARGRVDRLLSAPWPRGAQGLRDRALLEAMYATGARVQEACDWTLDDIRLDDRVVRCVGKGRKERWVPLGEAAADAIHDWLAQGRPAMDRGLADRVFLSRSGRALDRHAVFRLLHRRAVAAGLPPTFGPHALRHSFATHLLDGGADVRVVQELLGHANVRTTQTYTRVESERLKGVHRRHHPRG